MEIIKKSNRGPHKFMVVRGFFWNTRFVKQGDVIEVEGPEADGMVKAGRIIPEDLPPVGTYIALRPFILPGRDNKFECKALERIQLKAEDGLAKMFDGSCIPENEDQWRPANRRLNQKKTMSQGEIAALDKAAFQQKCWEMGILKGKK